MAQSSPQLDIQVLHDLRQRFPEIPEGVVSQCMLQLAISLNPLAQNLLLISSLPWSKRFSSKNNNNLEACCRALSQESSKYLYMEYHSPDDNRMNRNRLLHINLGIHSPSSYHPGDGAQLNGGRTLVHSSSDGHIDPQHAAGKQLICLVQEPHSAPAVVAATPNYNPFFMNEQNRSAATPPSQPPQQPSSMQTGMNPSAMQGPSPPPPPPSYMHIPRYSTNPITVTVSQNLPSGQTVPRALQILPQIPSNLYGSPGSIYIRQTSQSSSGRQAPQSTPWQSSPQGPVPHYSQRPLPVYPHQQNYQPSQYSPKQQQIPQSAYHSPPPSQCPSPFSSPQHQVQPSQLGHIFMPPSPSTTPPHPYQQGPPSYQKQGSHSVAYLPYTASSLPKGSMKKIEITVEPSQRPGTAINRSPSPISNQPSPRNQHSLYTATTPPSSSPSRGISSQPKPPFSVNPVYITYTQPTGPSCTPSPSPRVIPNPTTVFKITVGRATTENLLNLVDQEERSAAPEPIQPISVIPGSGGEKGSHKYQRSSSSGSDDYAYTQALLLHQRARMERLAKQLKLEKEELERLKSEVNSMEHDLMQRRLRRVSCTTAIPTEINQEINHLVRIRFLLIKAHLKNYDIVEREPT
ncbi:TGF-beta-activated kinase 1 and MAP3K7-binding protein 3 [Saguinus oedipus]|uniref:TGF-beta-activated kinase 1 and MAP3K7-binding protein 3 n=1 Tax=Saguinus oedipus TaxID=9490 RepID=A0ABQ9TEL0_SAGOE|nr:TGF-beta-activated kinase 1 and MAP3K7-binding protein 3 [Saguinus oedipus]